MMPTLYPSNAECSAATAGSSEFHEPARWPASARRARAGSATPDTRLERRCRRNGRFTPPGGSATRASGRAVRTGRGRESGRSRRHGRCPFMRLGATMRDRSPRSIADPRRAADRARVAGSMTPRASCRGPESPRRSPAQPPAPCEGLDQRAVNHAFALAYSRAIPPPRDTAAEVPVSSSTRTISSGGQRALRARRDLLQPRALLPRERERPSPKAISAIPTSSKRPTTS
jgi:hypothetical protein